MAAKTQAAVRNCRRPVIGTSRRVRATAVPAAFRGTKPRVGGGNMGEPPTDRSDERHRLARSAELGRPVSCGNRVPPDALAKETLARRAKKTDDGDNRHANGREKAMDLKLKGRKAVVTGGSKGIGRAIADALADEGCNVAICARDEREVSAAVAALKKKGVKALGESFDVRDREALDAW